MTDKTQAAPALQPERILSAPAQRALAEAQARRNAQLAAEANHEAHATRIKEINGRDGPEPVRYGDWEVKGIASDF